MDDNKSWNDIGKEIRDAVEGALQGDFTDLSDVVVNAVTDTVKNVSSAVGQAVSGITGAGQGRAGGAGNPGDGAGAGQGRAGGPGNPGGGAGRAGGPGGQGRAGGSGGPGGIGRAAVNYTEQYARATQERKRIQAERERAAREAAVARMKAWVPFKPIGRVSSVLYRVFGGIGTGVTAILSAVFMGIWLGTQSGAWLRAFGFVGVLLLIFIVMINVGCRQKTRLKRARKYIELCGNNHYANIEDLALHTNSSMKFVRRDVRKLLTDGFFPQGHLDAQESCLMLDDRIYGEYLKLEKQRKAQEFQKAQERGKEETASGEAGSTGQPEKETNRELEKMIAEGQDCIKKLRDMNDNIAGEEISSKLFRLENLLKEIFEGLRDHPEQLPQMQKFMNYYLPTTLKLVSAYEEFDSLSTQGEEILEAKAEIEKTLDTINSAFGELLNKLFRDTAFDVTTDAQVLQTMLAKEGLTRQKEFEKVPR